MNEFIAQIVIWLVGLAALGIAYMASAPGWVFAIILILFFGVFIISISDGDIDLNPFD